MDHQRRESLGGYNSERNLTIFFTENFTDTSLAARGWYGTSGVGLAIDSGAAHWTWDNGDFAPNEGQPGNRLFDSNTTPLMTLKSPTVYVSCDLKVGTNWSTEIPHLINFLTDADPIPEWDGGSPCTLDVIIQLNGRKARAYCVDGTRIQSGTILGDSYPHNNATPSLLGTTVAHAAMGGNGFQSGAATQGYFTVGPDNFNQTSWDSASDVFIPNTWHHVEAYVSMNSFSGGAAVADGVIKYWVDGALVINLTNIYLRTPGFETQKFGRLMLAPFLQPANGFQEMWMDNLVLADQPLAITGDESATDWYVRGQQNNRVMISKW